MSQNTNFNDETKVEVNKENNNMEKNYYDETQNNDQENQENAPQNNTDQEQNNTPEAPKKENGGLIKGLVIGGLTGFVVGVGTTIGFFAFKGRKAPKVEADKITGDVIEFAKGLAEKKAKEA